MFKQIVVCAGLLVFPAASSPSQDAQPGPGESMVSPAQTVGLLGTRFEYMVGSTAFEPGSNRIKPELLAAIAAWLSSNYELEPMDEPPAVAFVPMEVMSALQHRDVQSDNGSTSQAIIDGGTSQSSTVVAIYDDLGKTIYLPQGWSGSTPTELSLLVHEMVHHLQNLAGMTFACHEEREQLAYAAQQDWLALFGRDLFSDFGTDAFTLMARTQCAY